jgi:hypothetical protein
MSGFIGGFCKRSIACRIAGGTNQDGTIEGSPGKSWKVDNAEDQFYSHDPMSSSAMVLSALFTYQSDPNRALENVQSQLAVLDGYDQEVAFQFHVELLRLHTTRHPGPASAVRGHVEHAARQFPDNTKFLDTMLSLQAKSGLHSRLHALTARLTGSDSRLVGMVWAVWAEAVLATDLYHPGSGGASRVRSLLRRALSSILYVVVVRHD